jgi:hypothetical protein
MLTSIVSLGRLLSAHVGYRFALGREDEKREGCGKEDGERGKKERKRAPV